MDNFTFKPKSGDYISALLSEYQWLILLKGKMKKYEPLLEYLIDLGKYECLDEDNWDKQKRAVKYIAGVLNETSAHIAKWVVKIYDDLWELNEHTPDLFCVKGEIKCYFSCYSDDGYAGNFATSLPFLPCKSNEFEFDFFHPKTNTRHFYVDSIYINHEYGQTKIQICLRKGSANIYRDFLTEKAIFLRDIPEFDFCNLSSWDMDRKLREYARSGRGLSAPDPKIKNKRYK